MKFTIVGADRHSGEERQLILDAGSQDAARDEANRLGLLVSECVAHAPTPSPASFAEKPRLIVCQDCGGTATLSPDGRRGRCGSCGKVFEVPSPAAPVALAAEVNGATKTCPFCAEAINAKAIKCRWCGEMLNNGDTRPTPAPPPLPPLPAQHRPTPGPPQMSKGRPQSSVMSRLSRGGIIGVFNENVCAPEEQMRLTVKGPRTPGKAAKRIAFLALISIGSFIMLVVLAIGLGALFSGGSGTNNQSQQTVSISPSTFVEFDAKFCVHSRLTDLQKSKEIEGYKGQRVRWEGIVSYVSDDSVGFKHKATTSTYDVLLNVNSSERSSLTNLNNGDDVLYEGTIEDYGTLLPHSLKDGHVVSSHAMSSGDQLIFLANTETAVMKQIGGNTDQ